MNTALLLIDVQQSFVHRPYWKNTEVPAFLAQCNALVAGCQQRGVPVQEIIEQVEAAIATLQAEKKND